MIIDKRKANESFRLYTSNYDVNNEKINLKIVHTFKVCDNCEEISRALGLSEEDIQLSYIIGLLHDIGRFEQAKIYGTFNDSKSIDHAKLGTDILFKDNLIKKFVSSREYDDLIYKAIYNHNKFEIEDNLDDRTKLFCKIIRDADKIDIMRVAYECPPEDVYDCTKLEIENSLISKEVMESILNKRNVLRAHRKTGIDYVVSQLSLIFGIYFDESIKIVNSQGYIKKMIEVNSQIDETSVQLKKIRKVIMEYLQDRQK